MPLVRSKLLGLIWLKVVAPDRVQSMGQIWHFNWVQTNDLGLIELLEIKLLVHLNVCKQMTGIWWNCLLYIAIIWISWIYWCVPKWIFSNRNLWLFECMYQQNGFINQIFNIYVKTGFGIERPTMVDIPWKQIKSNRQYSTEKLALCHILLAAEGWINTLCMLLILLSVKKKTISKGILKRQWNRVGWKSLYRNSN